MTRSAPTFPLFEAQRSDLLRVRLREIAATARLESVNGAETVVKSAGRTALAPLNTAKDLVTQPAQTIGDTVRGVGHIFGTARATMNATDPHGDRIIASVTGGASARRKQAFDLGVDPNTSFPPLADQLKRVATADAVGATSANVGMSFVAGPLPSVLATARERFPLFRFLALSRHRARAEHVRFQG